MPNTRGVDYFVGDIHGHFEELAHILTDIGFSPTDDRLIGVGDLVDRGEDCDVVSEWLTQSFFFTVRGNHEELYLKWRAMRLRRAEQRAFEEDYYFQNGGTWVQHMEESEHQKLEKLLEDLPYFLAVPTANGQTVGVVHAELPDETTWPGLIAQAPTKETLESMTWGRWRLRQSRLAARGKTSENLPPPRDGNVIEGLDALVCGHGVVKQVQSLGNIVYLDTGGWRKTGRFSVLSMAEVLNQVTPKLAIPS